MQVFVDAACPEATDPSLVAIRPERVDLRTDDRLLERGGVLLLGDRLADGRSCLPVLGDLRRRVPQLVIYVCVARPDERIAAFARSGADDLFPIRGRWDVLDMLRQVSARVAAPPPEQELVNLAMMGLAPAVTRHIRFAFRNGYRDLKVRDAALRVGISCRTLRDQLLPSESSCMDDLLRCGRYLHLTELEERGVEGRVEHARRLGFGSATDLRQWLSKLRRSARKKARLRAFALRFARLHSLVG